MSRRRRWVRTRHLAKSPDKTAVKVCLVQDFMRYNSNSSSSRLLLLLLVVVVVVVVVIIIIIIIIIK